ncbi:MAG TPA: WecB/TagA/CpsF family glycosyltransferase [bacterium]|nr:WecB/TagA/CpsF family glycosyltransferase [bacterium]
MTATATPRRDAFLAALRQDFPPVDLFGVRVDAVPLGELARRLIEHLETADGPIHIVTLNPEILERALREPATLPLVTRAELIVPDGVGIRLASRRLASRKLPSVPGVDLAHELLRLSAARGWEVFLLGGAPGVAETAADRLKAEIPGLNIVGSDHGYHRDTPQDPKGETRVVNTLTAIQPDLLLVGMGFPRQEEFIARLRLHLKRGIVIGVGGSLDVFAGTVTRAPRWVGALNLKWLWRMAAQPKRWKRFPMLLAFARRVLFSQKT